MDAVALHHLSMVVLHHSGRLDDRLMTFGLICVDFGLFGIDMEHCESLFCQYIGQ